MSEKKDEKKTFEFLDKFPFFQKLKQTKHIGLIIAIIFALILVLILFGNFNVQSTSSSTRKISVSSTYQTSTEYAQMIESKLKSILQNIKGAGDVEVMISVKSGTSLKIAENSEEVTTSNSSDETTTTTTTEPIIIESGESKGPIIIGENLPTISGVVVVSSGASNVAVKLNLMYAVQTLIDVPQEKIQILVGK